MSASRVASRPESPMGSPARLALPAVAGVVIGNPPGKDNIRIKSRIAPLADRFVGFEDQLNLTRIKKKDDEEKKIINLQKQINALEASLSLESVRRTDSIQALQAWLLDEVVTRIEKRAVPIEASIVVTNERIDALIIRLEELEKEHKLDRDRFPIMIDQRCSELLQEIRQFRATFEREQHAREEKDKRILVQIRDQGNRLRAQFAAAKETQERKTSVIREELQEEIATRAKSTQMVREYFLDEIARVELAIDVEVKEREHADNELVSAVGHYAAALQDGIKIISAT